LRAIPAFDPRPIAMSLLANLFSSSIGRKFLMAISGLILTGFAFGHLLGNFQVFGHPDQINGYAHFLQGLGPALWLVRLVLLAALVVHVWAAVALTLESKSARGPEKYGVHKWLEATLASRTMRITGLVVFAFVIYHVLHFTVGLAGSDYYKGNIAEVVLSKDVSEFGIPLAKAGTAVQDVYSMIFIGFSSPIVAGFYILATALLAVHLWHGVDSLCQTVGLRNGTWSGSLRKIVGLLAFAYFLGNLAIPGAIITGIAKPAEATYAAQFLASR
jgi:succinate dehydrogenase / fumarate reductase cytochrome b subunit